MKRKLLSLALTLVMALALAVPASAATVESTYLDPYSEDEYWYTLRLELDRDPLAVDLPWSVEDGYMAMIYVPVGTKILSGEYSTRYFYDGEWQEGNEGSIHSGSIDNGLGLYITYYTAPDGTTLSYEEVAEIFGLSPEEWGIGPDARSVTLTQEGKYQIGVEALAHCALVYVVAPGSAYGTTVLAQSNGLEAKLCALKITAESTVTYNGQQIPLYTIIPGDTDNRNLYLKQVDGASYVVKTYTAKNSGGVLTEIEDSDTYEFTGEDGYYYSWWVGGTDVTVFEIAENGVVIQTLAMLPNGSAPAKPDAPGTYTVKKGDTWSSICINFYGDNAQRYALQKANKFVALKEGTVVTLPETLGKSVLIAAPVLAEGEVLYTVKAGDTLGKIALEYFGSMAQYKAIFERNADRLKNANTIYEGQVIVLPAK